MLPEIFLKPANEGRMDEFAERGITKFATDTRSSWLDVPKFAADETFEKYSFE